MYTCTSKKGQVVIVIRRRVTFCFVLPCPFDDKVLLTIARCELDSFYFFVFEVRKKNLENSGHSIFISKCKRSPKELMAYNSVVAVMLRR